MAGATEKELTIDDLSVWSRFKIALFIVFWSIFVGTLSFMSGVNTVRVEAIKNGCAEWEVINPHGSTVFTWKACD